MDGGEEWEDKRKEGRRGRGKPGARTHVTPLSVLSSYIRSRCDFLALGSTVNSHSALILVISHAQYVVPDDGIERAASNARDPVFA